VKKPGTPRATTKEAHLLPERQQLLDTPLRRIAGDDGRIDRADGDAGDPVRRDAGLGQLLIDAGLIGAEGAAALENQHAFLGTLGQCFGGRSAEGFVGRSAGGVVGHPTARRRLGARPLAGRLGFG
jgi:hypothetical protein